jgi:hypothetical protein
MLPAMRRGSLAMLARSMTRRGQHLVCLWLILALVGLTLEIARHSVHHADDEETAACAFASAAGHVPAVSAPSFVPAPLPPLIAVVATAVDGLDRSAPRLGTVDERAPPPPLFA